VGKARKIAHEFLSALRKILSARGVSRAWCLHEHLMSRTALVLIPVHEGAVAEIELRNLLNMMGWVFSDIVLDANVDTKFVDLRNLYKPLLINDVLGYNTGPEEPAGNSEIFVRCINMGATVQTDEMSIAMNFANLGLTFDTISLTLDDCCYAYSLLALAEGDLTALCNHGQHLQTEFTCKESRSKAGQANHSRAWFITHHRCRVRRTCLWRWPSCGSNAI
jgi:hypothetical protein